jgi:hypothetical protein
MNCDTVWIRPLWRAMWFITTALLVVSSTTMAQEKFNLDPGTYKGDIDTRNGDGAFELRIQTVSDGKLSGISLFHKLGPIECRKEFPMSGTITSDGVVHIESNQGVLSGCERTYDLKASSAGELIGTLVGPKGTWRVRLEKQ